MHAPFFNTALPLQNRGFFLRNVGLFWRNIGLFLKKKKFFSRNEGLFLCKSGLLWMKCRFDRWPCTNFAPVRTLQSLPHLLTPSHTHMHQHTHTHMHTHNTLYTAEQIEATVKELCSDRNDAEVGVKRQRVAAGWGAWWKKLTHESHDEGKS